MDVQFRHTVPFGGSGLGVTPWTLDQGEALGVSPGHANLGRGFVPSMDSFIVS